MYNTGSSHPSRLVAHATPTTVIDAVYDMLVNNNYSVKNARVLERLLPEAIYQSELTFVGFGEVNIGGYEFPVPLTPQFEYSDRYDPRPELGDQPLIARKGERKIKTIVG